MSKEIKEGTVMLLMSKKIKIERSISDSIRGTVWNSVRASVLSFIEKIR